MAALLQLPRWGEGYDGRGAENADDKGGSVARAEIGDLTTRIWRNEHVCLTRTRVHCAKCVHDTWKGVLYIAK